MGKIFNFFFEKLSLATPLQLVKNSQKGEGVAKHDMEWYLFQIAHHGPKKIREHHIRRFCLRCIFLLYLTISFKIHNLMSENFIYGFEDLRKVQHSLKFLIGNLQKFSIIEKNNRVLPYSLIKFDTFFHASPHIDAFLWNFT